MVSGRGRDEGTPERAASRAFFVREGLGTGHRHFGANTGHIPWLMTQLAAGPTSGQFTHLCGACRIPTTAGVCV